MQRICLQICLKEILNKRLGNGPADAFEIMEHPFFEDIDWNKLLKKEVQPPYIPKTKKIDDLRHIDPMFKDEVVKDTPNEKELDITEKEKNHFIEFTYWKEGHISQNIVYDAENDLSKVFEEDEDYEFLANSERNY